ncbi:MAG: hypothetical protein EOL87_08755 [Spartobacteria bacterium]|nr:hypothetical protein [Spartobacteria bacterium]
MVMNKYIHLFLSVLLLMFAATSIHAEWEIDHDAVHQFLSDGMDWAQEVSQEYDWELDWNRVGRDVESTLQSVDWSRVAAYLPVAREWLSFLDQWPETRPYADWLRQRIDYFQAASAYVHQPIPPTPVPTHRPPSQPIKPTPEPTRNPSTPANPATQENYWLTTLKTRPIPSQARQLIPTLKQCFSKQHVPSSLIWLAEVESSFNPEARSPVGAAGLFQFMPATAKRFGISLSPEDQRFNPAISATAAAKYLHILHKRFHTWPLALAAYNCGEGRVSKIQKKTGKKSFADISYALPVETQMYVPKVLAIIKLREGE